MNVDFCLPEYNETKIVSRKYHVVNKNNSRYDNILGRDLLTALVLDLKFFEKSLLLVMDHMKGVKHHG